jgi:glucokinase
MATPTPHSENLTKPDSSNPDTNSPWVVGVDLGATKIAAGLVNPEDEIVDKVYVPTNAGEGPQAVVERIAGCVARLETALPAGTQLAAIGVCCPGPLDHNTGMVVSPPNLTGWLEVPLQAMLEMRLKLPAPIEHDAKAAALGEFYFGAGRDTNDLIYIVVGTGVGAAIIIDGELYRGSTNSAGEVGHITVDMNGPACSCGSNGCLEVFTAGPDLVDRLRDLAALEEVDLPEDLDGAGVAELAAQGHPQAQAVFQQAGRALGVGIAALAHILDIETYIIGGSVVQAGELLLAPTREAVRYRAYESIGSRIKVIASPLGDDAPILGMAQVARQGNK